MLGQVNIAGDIFHNENANGGLHTSFLFDAGIHACAVHANEFPTTI
jgi:hypothetical protein